MKQTDGVKMAEAPPPEKPKRGRPKKEGALTGAERAKRYREAARTQPKFAAETKTDSDQYHRLRTEITRLNRLVGYGELQNKADSIVIKNKDAMISQLRRELKQAKQPPKKQNVTDAAFQTVTPFAP